MYLYPDVPTPSSGASERVFSTLKLFYGEQQHRALHDIIFASLCFSLNDRSFDQYVFKDMDTHDAPGSITRV